MRKFPTKVPHLWCDSHTSFKVKRSKVKVTRPINAHTHRAPYLPNGKAYELQTWYTDGGRRPASATGTMISKVKGQSCKVTWSVWAVLAQCCSCVISGRRGHTLSAGRTWQPHFLFYMHLNLYFASWDLMQHPPTKVRAVITDRSTGSGFDLAWFSSQSSKRLCVFGLHGAIFFCLHPSLYLLVSRAWWDWRSTWWLTIVLQCHDCWLGHLTRQIVSEMTYVSHGTLNPTIPYHTWYKSVLLQLYLVLVTQRCDSLL